MLGGARSGKSTFAESLAAKVRSPVTYISATAEGRDEEMIQRIQRHRAKCPWCWETVEAPFWPRSTKSASDKIGGRYPGGLSDPVPSPICSCKKKCKPLDADQREEKILHEVTVLGRRPRRRGDSHPLSPTEVGWGVVPIILWAGNIGTYAGLPTSAWLPMPKKSTLVVAGIPLNLKDLPVGR